MEHHSPLGSSGSIGSPIGSNASSTGSGGGDTDKLQKIAAGYQKIKTQNAILKKAILQEQEKTSDLEKIIKEKDQTIATKMQEHDVLEFNNQRLTKRIQLMQDQMNEKKEGGWGFGRGSKVELQKKDDEILALRHELQEKIDDNESLHSVQKEKELAFKTVESQLRSTLGEKDLLIEEKDLKIQELLDEQKEAERKLVDQTQGLREHIVSLQQNMSSMVSTIKLRDDVLIQLNELIHNGFSNLPNITLDYPLENITPSNERFVFEDLYFDKEFRDIEINQDLFNVVTDKKKWSIVYKNIISNLQSFLGYHLSQVSNIIGAHYDNLKLVNDQHELQVKSLNETIGQLSLEKEENAFTLNAFKEDLLERERELMVLKRDFAEQKEFLEQLNDSNREFEEQIQKEQEKYNSTKLTLENEIKELKKNFEVELKQLKDQHQGLLKHQKQLLTSTIDQQSQQISQLEKKTSLLESNLKQSQQQLFEQHQQFQQQLQQQQQQLQLQQQQQNEANNNTLVNLMDDFQFNQNKPITPTSTSPTLSPINNNNNNNNNSNGSLVDLSFMDMDSTQPQSQPQQQKTLLTTDIVEESLVNENNNTQDLESNESPSPPVSLQKQQQPIHIEQPPIILEKSDRFKLTVLDETGEEFDSLNFSLSDKEREREMKIYYENKITQLLNKISNIDAKAMRYYEQYNQLQNKKQESDELLQQLESARLESKNVKEELEVTRVNYDQQMRILTEQFISLNESVTHMDTELLRIKQHKVVCGKCKNWNLLEHIFSNENQNLFCSKGHPVQTIQL
eukprot:gene3948-4931_t